MVSHFGRNEKSKLTMKSHSTPIKKAKDKNRQTSLNIDKNMEQSELS